MDMSVEKKNLVIQYLMERPIAVSMTFIGVILLGILAINNLPVSLMPDIKVPEIIIQLNYSNTSARELENTAVRKFRRDLSKTTHLSDIDSYTRDEISRIRLRFDYGTDMDYALIEVNEKVDLLMSSLPSDMPRPKIIKANISDIPVFYLNVAVKKDSVTSANRVVLGSGGSKYTAFPQKDGFIELSQFASNVIKKRIEQLSDVAMVDMTGVMEPEILIVPDNRKLQSLQITLDQFDRIIKENRRYIGSMVVHNGQYEYNVRFNSELQNRSDVGNLYFKVDDRILQVHDVAEVKEGAHRRSGIVCVNGSDAIAMAIIKQSSAQLGSMEEHLKDLINNLELENPGLEFTITRDQTELLNYSIDNLVQDLAWGGILAFLVMFFFLQDFKSPLLIGITLPTSLIISLALFYVGDISVNIISLSGLVLGVGMMIDNSIIVIDNISQYVEKGETLYNSCARGASEVFIPMLSSVFTTGSVFIPLLYLSGISGALFHDEAISIIIGAVVSLMVSVTLIPVLYHTIYIRHGIKKSKWVSKINKLDYESRYESTMKYVFRNQILSWSIILLLVISGIFAFNSLYISQLPATENTDMTVHLDWNESINVEENNRRTQLLISGIGVELVHYSNWSGNQQFLLNDRTNLTSAESIVDLKLRNASDMGNVSESISRYLDKEYPLANFYIRQTDNIFNFIFPDDQAPLEAKLRYRGGIELDANESLSRIFSGIQEQIPDTKLAPIRWAENLTIQPDALKLVSLGISEESLYSVLKSAMNQRHVGSINNGSLFMPIVIGGIPQYLDNIISSQFVSNEDGLLYPVRDVLSINNIKDLKEISAGLGGEYFPLRIETDENKIDEVVDKLKKYIRKGGVYDVDFTGSIFSSRELVSQLFIVLIVSLFLLYLILAIQFESLSLPLIILLEVPIDILGVFIFLKVFDAGLNMMSLIGIIVMSGIIINDSILKIDTINRLYLTGMPLLKSIMEGGRRRLKSIIMTSLTTVLGMVPLLLTPGLGSDLQRPLAISLIGGMIIGTIVSIYYIPLCYYYLKK